MTNRTVCPYSAEFCTEAKCINSRGIRKPEQNSFNAWQYWLPENECSCLCDCPENGEYYKNCIDDI